MASEILACFNGNLRMLFLRYLMFIAITCSELIFPHSISAQNSYYLNDFNHYTTEQGLINNTVRCIIQDSLGFLWIGTNTGLEKFNGYSFTHILPQRDADGLGETIVTSVFINDSNDIWIGTIDGLSKYTHSTNKFINYRNDPDNPNSLSNNHVSFIYHDKKGNLWIGTRGGGVNLLDEKSGKFTHIIGKSKRSDSLKINTIYEICIDKNGIMWLGTESGISILDIDKMKLRDYYLRPHDLDKFENIPVLSLVKDKAGSLWIGTWQKGLYRIDIQNNIVIHDMYDGINNKEQGGASVSSLYCDSYGQVWAGTRNGLLKYNPGDKSIIKIVNDPLNPNSLSNNFVISLFEDKNNNLWVGTRDGGLNQLKLNQKKFLYYRASTNSPLSLSCSVSAIYQDKKDNIWMGTCNGLALFDQKEQRFIKYLGTTSVDGLGSNSEINCIAEGKEPYLWIGTNDGVVKFNTVNHHVIFYSNDPKNKNSLSNNTIYCIYHDKEGILWIGTSGGGLCRFDEENGKFTNYQIDSADLSKNKVVSIVEDDAGNLWLGTYGRGLVEFNKKNRTSTYFEADPENPEKLNSDFIISLSKTKDKKILIGTFGGGISIFDPVNKNFKTYTREDGLPSNEIRGILQDKNGNLWISTNSGISRIEFSDNITGIKPEITVTNFDSQDGLIASAFNSNACLNSSSGEMYFGGTQGMNAFFPDSIKPSKYKYNIVITNLFVLSKPVNIGKDVNGRVILDKPLQNTKKIVLSHKEYTFSLTFAALHYNSPSSIKYFYKLDGFENDWIESVNNRRSVNYSNLKPGKYTFHVKALDKEGIWSKQEASLQFIILPPWWETWLFRILFITSLIIAVVSVYLLRITKLKKQQKFLKKKIKERTSELQKANIELEEHRNHLENLVEVRNKDLIKALRKAEESDRLKSSFLANMSHEIRTPMNAIMGFSTLLKENVNSEKQRNEFTDIIQNSANSLLTLINEILEISKIEAGQMEIFPSAFSVDKIFIELKERYDAKYFKKIEFKYIKNPKKPVIKTDLVRFRQIISYILDNALKFTESGYVHFGYKIQNGTLECYVKDTGTGIKSTEIEKIFHPFVKLEHNTDKLYRGAGLGLAICKKLAEILGGKIWVDSRLNEGSTFYFSLPYEKELQEKSITKNSKQKLKIHSWQDISILVAEDEQFNFEYIEEVLTKTKANLYWAKNGKQAIEYIRQNGKYDISLILMDLKLPGMCGTETFREIRKLNKTVPVIAQSAFSQENEIQNTLKIGFSDYLVKPIKPNVLIETIQKHIDCH